MPRLVSRQGGFRLSLFGYDLAADHAALTQGDTPRVDVAQPRESLALQKASNMVDHGGGKRATVDSWMYRVLERWIERGAAGMKPSSAQLQQLRIEPAEIVCREAEEQIQLRVLATWTDATCEDVTPLCRFQTNNDGVAVVDEHGVITGKESGDTHVVAFYDEAVATVAVLRPVPSSADFKYPAIVAATKIDGFIQTKLKALGIVPAEVCSDTEFLRRVSLDLTGTLPIPAEIDAFIADTAAEKRLRKIDELLARPTYVARWTTKLCEITGNSPRHFQDQAPPEEYARNWYEWIARRVGENMPYDELIAGLVLGRSREADETYEQYARHESAYYRQQEPADFTARPTMPYYWAKHTLRLPEERALNFSYAFLGVRIDCAQCHKHPFDRWTQDDFQSFTALFERIGYGISPEDSKTYKQMIDKSGDQGNQAQRVRARLQRAQRGEIVPWLEVFVAAPGSRVEKGRVNKVDKSAVPRVLGGVALPAETLTDPRVALAAWLRDPQNPYFARVFVNRVWAEYFGTGIIHPPDDLNLANAASNQALLDYLTAEFIEHGYDMRWLHREIVSSHAYQRSLQSNATNRLDERNFSRMVARRLPADMLFDAITQATASTADLQKATTDLAERAIGPAGGAYVGRYRDGNYASTVFGRSPRDTNCDCSASHEPNLLQAIYLQNDKDLTAALDRKSGWLHELEIEHGKQMPATNVVEATIHSAYQRTLCRAPRTAELSDCAEHIKHVGSLREGMYDILWALLNSREFLTNH